MPTEGPIGVSCPSGLWGYFCRVVRSGERTRARGGALARGEGSREGLAGGRAPKATTAGAVPGREVGQAQAGVPEPLALKVLSALFS